jgi:hypothetical protein
MIRAIANGVNTLGTKRFPHFAIICSRSGGTRMEILEFQFWNGKGVLTFVGGSCHDQLEFSSNCSH